MNDCHSAECPVQTARTMLAVKLFRGLADPTRLTILQALGDGPLRVVDLMNVTGRAQPNVSAHLASLKDCGLVTATPNGRETFYALADCEMSEILTTTEGLLKRIGPKLCGCPWYEG